ncbi:protein of unknown function [Moritella yayanosii]|uniref:Uncharacterized protein n=1 Tax=Moritella yayanosii TaxID=69539 RepID=A0A330LUL3_9GAMM|nr:protein of unknown function [Moritella yayanosii]
MCLNYAAKLDRYCSEPHLASLQLLQGRHLISEHRNADIYLYVYISTRSCCRYPQEYCRLTTTRSRYS